MTSRFALALHRAECEYVTRQLGPGRRRISARWRNARRSSSERRWPACVSILYTARIQSIARLRSCLEYLRHVGVDWSPHPSAEDARREYDRIWSQARHARNRGFDRPAGPDRSGIARHTRHSDETLNPYMSSTITIFMCWSAVGRSISASSVATARRHAPPMSAWRRSSRAPNSATTRRDTALVGLATNLVERHGWHGFQPRTYMLFGGEVLPWTRPVRAPVICCVAGSRPQSASAM